MTEANRRRTLGCLAAAGPLAFTLAWAIASAGQGGYSPVRNDLSALAATGADHPWITIAGDLLLGAGILALGAGLANALPGRDVIVGSWLLLGAGLATAIQAVVREDCPSQLASCAARERAGVVSWHQPVHDVASGLAFLAVLAAPLVLARPFRCHRCWRDLATYSMGTAAVGLVLLVAYVGTATSPWGGLSQRIFLTVPLGWITVVGIRLSRHPAV